MTKDSAPTAELKRSVSFTPKQLTALCAVGLVALALGGAIGYAATQPQVTAAQTEAAELSEQLNEAEDALEKAASDSRSTEVKLTEATATVDKLMAGRDPIVLKLDFALPDGYPIVVDISAVPEHMQQAIGTPQAVAVAPGVWAALSPGATVESAVNARTFDGYCASKLAFETQYLNGASTSGSCW